jgi:hypothetical protein
MLRLTCDNPSKSGLLSRWLRDLPSGTGIAESIGVRHANQAPIVLALFILTQAARRRTHLLGVSPSSVIGIESNTYLVT